MKVDLLQSTGLATCATAIRTCWQSFGNSDSIKEYDTIDGSYIGTTVGPKDKELIDRIGNKFKHASTLEHIVYTFYISGVSRALLQEVARHRMASPSVKSTRYTLSELKNEELFVMLGVGDEGEPFMRTTEGAIDRAEKYLVKVDGNIDISSMLSLDRISKKLRQGEANDKVKYLLPECYKTELTWTINARSLQNFLHLRSSKSALWEIRDLANTVYSALPEDHMYLFTDCLAEV